MSARQHADTWPEAAIIPYAPDMGWLTNVVMHLNVMRTWADASHVPGIRELTPA